MLFSAASSLSTSTMDKMSMSLDDIINMNKSGNGGGGGSGGGKMSVAGQRRQRRQTAGGGGGGGPGYAASAQNLAAQRLLRRQSAGAALAPAAQLSASAPLPLSNKVLVSNLAETVSDADVRELFSEFGALRYWALHHDAAGASLGTADVIFDSPSAARAACRKYNGVPLDGRAMNIQLAVTDLQVQQRQQMMQRQEYRIAER